MRGDNPTLPVSGGAGSRDPSAVQGWLRLAVALFLLGLLTAGTAEAQRDRRTVRVGVYHNPPIVIFNPDGTYDGLSIRVLQETADEEGWELEWVPGIWEETFGRLLDGKVDLLVGIGYSAERAARFPYSKETIINTWGVVYRSPRAPITSILDLSGRTIAVARGAIHNEPLYDQMEEFGIEYEIVEVDDFYVALDMVEAGDADAVLLNRLFATLEANRYDVVATGIIFDPIDIRYAVPPDGDTSLLDAIDRTFLELRDDPDSSYNVAKEQWLSASRPGSLAVWMQWAIGITAGLAALFLLGTLLLRREVRQRTEQLEKKSRQLEREVTERKQAQEQLNHLTFYDSLSGLPNRFLFRDRLIQALSKCKEGQMVGVLYLDVDRFKTINDSHGHSSGDILLRAIAERLRRSVREVDTVSRWGGDEFTILLTELTGPEEATAVADRIVDSCSSPFHVWGEQVYSTLSIGIALSPRDGQDADSLLRAADAAMYYVKQNGRATYHFYSPELTTQATERLMLETELREAMYEGDLTVHYQPICDLSTRRVLALEALLRLRHPTRGWLPPETVIPVAEETGLILEIGDRVLQQSCLQMRSWLDEGIAPHRMSVNVSSRQFTSDRLLRSVDAAVGISGMPPSYLQVELTESLFVDGGPASVSLIEQLRSRDIRICIDDFGTGYSSLGYLQRLPIDTLKIDRSFIEDVPQDARAQRITAAILALASGLNLEAVAEGIETHDQMAYLQRQGCRLGQGYLLSRPLPADEMGAWLRGQLEPSRKLG